MQAGKAAGVKNKKQNHNASYHGLQLIPSCKINPYSSPFRKAAVLFLELLRMIHMKISPIISKLANVCFPFPNYSPSMRLAKHLASWLANALRLALVV